jgi:hypothetical protein
MFAEVTVPDGAIMTVWVIYERPTDRPNGYVLRPQFAMKDNTVLASHTAWAADDPDTLRAILPPGLTRLMPAVDDDPKILETWI